MADDHRFGFVAVAGPPNAGKSTLQNRLVGEKVSIVSRKPQTTRHRITGIRTGEGRQVAYVDTPGLHAAKGAALNRVIVRTALSSLGDVDLILLVMDHRGWDEGMQLAFSQATAGDVPVLLVINKIDRFKDKTQLLPLIEESRNRHPFVQVFPVSALRDPNSEIMKLEDLIVAELPEGPPGFPHDQLCDRGEGFLAAELIREQVFSTLGRELPYSSAVEIEKYEVNDKGVLVIDAVIWVEKESQKPIVIGKNGRLLKMIGVNCRKQMEMRLHERVFLNLWVRVKKGWSDNMKHLRSLGYGEA